MNLSKRLSFLRSFHHDGESIWDIGCDHGQLGLSFAEDEGIKSINLVDPSEPVIHKLVSKLKDSYITIPDFIKTHHKKGQEIILSSEKKTVFIAGMGGREIIEIMSHLILQLSSDDLLVISPHRNLLLVREWLRTSDLRLSREDVVQDEGKFYPVLCLKKDNTLPKVSLYGEEIWKSEVGKAFLNHELTTFSRHQDETSRTYISYLSSILLN